MVESSAILVGSGRLAVLAIVVTLQTWMQS